MIIYISTSKLKKDTTLGSAVDDNIIHPCIRMAQERYIIPILGTDLREKLDTLITDGTISDAGNAKYKKILDDYIQPALVQFAFAEVAIFLRVRFSNNSITVPSSEQGSSADREDIKQLLDRARHMGNYYAERLIDYLFDQTSNIPEMSSNQYPDLSPSRINYNGGLNIYRTYPLPNQIKAFLQAIGARYLTYK